MKIITLRLMHPRNGVRGDGATPPREKLYQALLIPYLSIYSPKHRSYLSTDSRTKQYSQPGKAGSKNEDEAIF